MISKSKKAYSLYKVDIKKDAYAQSIKEELLIDIVKASIIQTTKTVYDKDVRYIFTFFVAVLSNKIHVEEGYLLKDMLTIYEVKKVTPGSVNNFLELEEI